MKILNKWEMLKRAEVSQAVIIICTLNPNPDPNPIPDPIPNHNPIPIPDPIPNPNPIPDPNPDPNPVPRSQRCWTRWTLFLFGQSARWTLSEQFQLPDVFILLHF